MSKKYPKSEAINDAQYIGQDAYVTWGDDLDSKNKALSKSSEALDEYSGVQHSSAAPLYLRNDFSNMLPNISGKPGLSRSDYDYFRPQEAVPQRVKEIMRKADDIYQKVGLVKNVIDLMGDFSCQGIRLVHPNKRIERFYRNWFEKIKGEERSERFLNNLYRIGNVVINRQTAKISIKIAEDLHKSTAAADLIVNQIEPQVEKREIPWRYTFIDPVYVDVVGGPLSSFVGDKSYCITMPAGLRKLINAPKDDAERAIINQLPPALIEAAKSKKPFPLDPEKTSVFHYKKDDWKTWAYPMIYAILDDINIVEKLKLADLAALDGAISNIRIFKLGSLEHRIAPTQAAASKLSSILQNNMGGGTMDLVWGPDIELLESKTSVHQFLGEGKYTPHLNAIYAGLGIPPTLTGTYGAAGTTNNFISLKTLTQRLQYGRKVLTSFWKKEIAIVQKAMGFRFPAKIEFDRMDLSNEDAEKALLIQLADRNIISDELLQRIFGFDPDMEKSRINREDRDRSNNRMTEKAGPYFNPQLEDNLKKIALQTGIVTPSQVGLELLKKKPSEQTSMEMKIPKIPPQGGSTNTDTQPAGVSGQGRPRNSKDSEKRKTKRFAPQTGASLQLWAIEAQDKISDIMNPLLLEFYQKKNMRSLSKSEYEEAEDTKTKIFLSLNALENIQTDNIIAKLNTINNIETINMSKAYKNLLNNVTSQMNRPLTIDELKYTKAYFYQTVYHS